MKFKATSAHYGYKDLERGKWVKIDGWGDAQAARDEVLASVERFNSSPDKPNF